MPPDSLIASPARDELVYRFLRGDSVVWIVLRDGDDPADTAMVKWLTDALNHVEIIVPVPQGIGRARFGAIRRADPLAD